ncbi:MAG: imidazolonepropionase-like domain-containing protein, partial [bacterium]
MSYWPAHDPSGKAVAGRTAYLILHNTSEVVTPDAEGREILRFPKGAIVFRGGRVHEVGPAAELFRNHPDARPLNANGKLVTPGLVDCHTHMIFGGHRAEEFQMKLAGASYAEIAARGGGIRSTVQATAAVKEEVLEKTLANRLERWRANGCTTVEVKSGYGLTTPREVRLLELMAGALEYRTALLDAEPDGVAEHVHCGRHAAAVDLGQQHLAHLGEVLRTAAAELVGDRVQDERGAVHAHGHADGRARHELEQAHLARRGEPVAALHLHRGAAVRAPAFEAVGEGL